MICVRRRENLRNEFPFLAQKCKNFSKNEKRRKKNLQMIDFIFFFHYTSAPLCHQFIHPFLWFLEIDVMLTFSIYVFEWAERSVYNMYYSGKKQNKERKAINYFGGFQFILFIIIVYTLYRWISSYFRLWSFPFLQK